MKIQPKKSMWFGTVFLSADNTYDVVKVRLGPDPGYMVRRRVSAKRYQRAFVPACWAVVVE